MRVAVRHGHFAFYPHARDEVGHFYRVFNLKLYPEEDYFTFEELIGLPRWSQVGRLFGTTVAIATYEGRRPWDVMRANKLVYSLQTGLLVPYTSFVASIIAMPQTVDYLIAPRPVIQPGVILSTANQLKGAMVSYYGEINIKEQKLSISSVETL